MTTLLCCQTELCVEIPVYLPLYQEVKSYFAGFENYHFVCIWEHLQLCVQSKHAWLLYVFYKILRSSARSGI